MHVTQGKARPAVWSQKPYGMQLISARICCMTGCLLMAHAPSPSVQHGTASQARQQHKERQAVA